jgi:integrase
MNLEIRPTRPTPVYLPAASTEPKPIGDTEALRSWLQIFDRKSQGTARHYRTQVGKFQLFLRLIHPERDADHQIRLATESDVTAYELALGPLDKGARDKLLLSEQELFQHGLTSQPFARDLKATSVNQALSVLNALYEFLRTPNGAIPFAYVSVNPVTRVRRSGDRSVRQTDRHIPLDGIQAMNEHMHRTIEAAKSVGDRKLAARYERMLWIFTLLFGVWGRREEVSQLTMGDFKQGHDEKWKATLHRKGGKDADVTIAKWVLDALRRYRTALGLPRNWSAGDRHPAIVGHTPKGQPAAGVSAQTIYLEIRALARATAQDLHNGLMLPDISPERREMLEKRLNSCSPHWFRHSGPTIAINSGAISIELASKMLGHSTLDTTSQMYYHADDAKMLAGLDALGAQLG